MPGPMVHRSNRDICCIATMLHCNINTGQPRPEPENPPETDRGGLEPTGGLVNKNRDPAPYPENWFLSPGQPPG